MSASPYPPHRPVTVAEAVLADAEATELHGIPTLVLMEHAGRGLARIVAELLPPGGVVAVLCGPGNNGGDGYACARFLLGWGIPVRAVHCASSPPERGDAAFERDLVSREIPVPLAASIEDARVVDAAVDGAAVVVDALFGVGLSRSLRPPYPSWIQRLNAAPATRVSADVPSGLVGDDGVPSPVAVVAHVTAAMGFVKRGLTTEKGAPYAGRVVEVDVGLPGPVHRPFLA